MRSVYKGSSVFVVVWRLVAVRTCERFSTIPSILLLELQRNKQELIISIIFCYENTTWCSLANEQISHAHALQSHGIWPGHSWDIPLQWCFDGRFLSLIQSDDMTLHWWRFCKSSRLKPQEEVRSSCIVFMEDWRHGSLMNEHICAVHWWSMYFHAYWMCANNTAINYSPCTAMHDGDHLWWRHNYDGIWIYTNDTRIVKYIYQIQGIYRSI